MKINFDLLYRGNNMIELPNDIVHLISLDNIIIKVHKHVAINIAKYIVSDTYNVGTAQNPMRVYMMSDAINLLIEYFEKDDPDILEKFDINCMVNLIKYKYMYRQYITRFILHCLLVVSQHKLSDSIIKNIIEIVCKSTWLYEPADKLVKNMIGENCMIYLITNMDNKNLFDSREYQVDQEVVCVCK